MMIYNTPREAQELGIIRKIIKSVICPNNDIGDTSKGMRTYLQIVKWAEVVIASEYKGHIGGGVYSEIHRALISKIPVLCLRDGKLYNVFDAKVVNDQDQKVRFAKLIIQE
jgi:hypothetical protein